MTMDHESISEEVGRTISITTWRNFLYKHGIGVMETMLAEDEDIAKAKAKEEVRVILLLVAFPAFLTPMITIQSPSRLAALVAVQGKVARGNQGVRRLCQEEGYA